MAELEQLVLGGVVLNSTTLFGLEAVDFTPPAKKPEWANSADSDGQDLIRTPLFDNRVITCVVRVKPQASKNLALEKLGELVDQLQEAEKNPGGIALEWTPSESTKTITFDVLTGSVTGLPVVQVGEDAGWMPHAPKITIQLTCKPFGRGLEVEAAAAKSIETGLSVVVITLPTVAGDVPAEGRLVVKDTAAVGRRFVEWGLENRYYNAATSLILDSEDMTPVGGAQSTVLGSPPAYKRAAATKWSIATTLFGEPTVCCNTGVLKHVGTFRVKARVQATTETVQNVYLRLAWQDGEGPLRGNGWQTPVLPNKLVEADLGIITVTEAQIGSQKWLGQIEAYSLNKAGADVLHVDYLTFVPVLEGYGKALGPNQVSGATIVAYDGFETGSGALNARTPQLGAAWASTGAATDWTVEPDPLRYLERHTKSDSEPRFGAIGSALGASKVSCSFTSTTAPAAAGEQIQGLVLRFTNKENYAFGLIKRTKGNLIYQIGTVVAGATVSLGERTVAGIAGSVVTEATLSATLDGTLTLSIATGLTLSATSAAIESAGALKSGKAGIYDRNTVATEISRRVDAVGVSSLATIPYCIQPSRTLEVRSDSTIAQDSTGTYYGPVPVYRGSRFFVPQDGSANRTSRIIVKADRNDLEEADQEKIADAFTAQAFVTPRYHVIPR